MQKYNGSFLEGINFFGQNDNLPIFEEEGIVSVGMAGASGSTIGAWNSSYVDQRMENGMSIVDVIKPRVSKINGRELTAQLINLRRALGMTKGELIVKSPAYVRPPSEACKSEPVYVKKSKPKKEVVVPVVESETKKDLVEEVGMPVLISMDKNFDQKVLDQMGQDLHIAIKDHQGKVLPKVLESLANKILSPLPKNPEVTVLGKINLEQPSVTAKPNKKVVPQNHRGQKLFHTFKAIIPDGLGGLEVVNSIRSSAISNLPIMGKGLKVSLDKRVVGYNRLGPKTSWSMWGKNVVVGEYRKNDVPENTIFLLVDNQAISDKPVMFGEISIKLKDGTVLYARRRGDFSAVAFEKRKNGSGGYLLMTILEPGDSVEITTAAPIREQRKYSYKNVDGRLSVRACR